MVQGTWEIGFRQSARGGERTRLICVFGQIRELVLWLVTQKRGSR